MFDFLLCLVFPGNLSKAICSWLVHMNHINLNIMDQGMIYEILPAPASEEAKILWNFVINS